MEAFNFKKFIPDESIIERNNSLQEQFDIAFMNLDINYIEPILSENGAYFKTMNKQKALEYIDQIFQSFKLYSIISLKLVLRFSLDVNIGNPVFLYNCGILPGTTDMQTAKAISLSFKDGVIHTIDFSYNFCNGLKLQQILSNN